MKKALIIIFFISGFLSMRLQAQVSTLVNLPQQWTLNDCIEYAKKNNIQLNSLRLSSSSAQQDLLQSKAARLPSVSGSVSQSLVNAKNADVVVGGFQSQANVSGNYAVNSSVTLYNGGYLKNDIKSKELALQSSNLNVEETQNDITLTITEGFLNILLAKENIIYLQDVLATSQAQLKQGQQRFDAGSISRKDLLQLQGQVAGDEYNLVNANNSYRQNIVTLKQTLQLPTVFDFKVAVPDTLIVQQMGPALSAAQETAQSVRPEIKNGELGIQSAQIDLLKAKAGTKPIVSLGANLATGYNDNNTGSKYFSQLNNNFYQSLGLTVSIPIYSRRVNKTNIEKSKIAIEQAELSLAEAKTELNSKVEQAYINVENTRAQYTAAEVQLKATQESYTITNEQLKLGAINMIDVLQQKNLYVQALQSYIQSKYSAVLYNKIYDFYTGVPVTF